MPQPIENCVIFSGSQNCLARALYDNIAESPDELAFRKGDILVVLEQNTANIEGWWLCSLRGRQGICPGNRLRLIAGVFEDQGQSREPSPQLTEVLSDLSTLQRQGKRRSWHVQPNQVLTPKKYNDVYLYDTPPRAVAVSYDSPKSFTRFSPAPSISPINRDSGENYDVPRPLANQHNHLTPSSSISSLTTGESLSSSNRSSVINMPDYDIPRPCNHSHLSLNPIPQVYDVPPSNTQIKELPLELSFALDTLEKLESETTSAISKLLGFVSPNWRTTEKLENTVMDIKLSVMRLRTSLQDLAEFSEGALGNATRASDKNLASKLTPLVTALQNSDRLIQEASAQLQKQDWSIELLARSENNGGRTKPDSLEQLVACARALTEDVRQTASFIQGNSTLLFKKVASPQGNNNSEWLEDYDYVNLESKEAVSKTHAEIRDALPKELKKGYDNLVKNAESVELYDNNVEGLDPEDKQILSFFATQVITHHIHLTQAIDAFLQTVEHNQPPKLFLAHGKFIVLSAHKLVNIGDAVHRNIVQSDTRTRALNCANALNGALATSVNKTKQAALQFPSVAAVQEMVDSVVDISHLARDLKMCLVQAAQST